MAMGSNCKYMLGSSERERGCPFRQQRLFQKPPANLPWHFIGHNQSYVHSWTNSCPPGKRQALFGLGRGVLINCYWGSWNLCYWLRFSSSEIHPPIVGQLLHDGEGTIWVTGETVITSAELGWDKDMVILRVGFHDKSLCTLPSSLQNFAVQKILAIWKQWLLNPS